jgi:hypothetical protein
MLVCFVTPQINETKVWHSQLHARECPLLPCAFPRTLRPRRSLSRPFPRKPRGRPLLSCAADAFFARAVLSSGVMASSERLPPIFPPFRPNLAHSLAEDGAVTGSMRAA